MTMGKIIVGSDVGGMKELITNNIDGFLFKAGDVDALSKLLTELAFKKEDFEEISKAAIEKVQRKHRWDLAVKQYLPVYKKLVNKLGY